MINVNCQIDIPKVEGLNDQELTVGREFYLSCKGDWPKNLDQDKLQLVVPKEAAYQIKLLSFEFRSPEVADLKVTTYRAMPAQFNDLQLTDGNEVISLGAIQYKVASVIEKPQDPNQKTEPFGPMGPATVPVPMLYIAVGLALLITVITGVVIKVYHSMQRRRLLQRLKHHDSAQTPIAQFYQTIRKLQRENPVFFSSANSDELLSAFQCLQEAWLLFVIREFRVPAAEWSDSLILADIKKYHRVIFDEHALAIKKNLKEFQHVKSNLKTLSDKDVLVLLEHTRKLIESIEQTRRGAK